jgi:hypothetical protein
MKLPSTKAIAANGAAVMVIGVAVVTQIKSYFAKPEIPSCATYYESAVGLGLERNGKLVTAVDIQAGAAGADYGVLDNLTTTALTNGPAAHAMVVAIRRGTSHPDHSREARGGVVFPWKPRALPSSAPSVCLSYHVLLPETFEFGTGVGTLPGISASSMDVSSDEAISFHFGWGSDGKPRMRFLARSAAEQRRDTISGENVLPRGRWFKVDQEIGLNTGGQSNGLMRFWIDGELAAANWSLPLRSSDAVKFDGVLADIHFGYLSTFSSGVATRDETISVSPFELRWRK